MDCFCGKSADFENPAQNDFLSKQKLELREIFSRCYLQQVAETQVLLRCLVNCTRWLRMDHDSWMDSMSVASVKCPTRQGHQTHVARADSEMKAVKSQKRLTTTW